MAQSLERWLHEPRNLDAPHIELAYALATAQLNHKANQRVAATIQRTRLPTQAALTGVRTGAARGLSATQLANLATCDWVRAGAPVAVTGPTQSGKTYLAGALVREVVARGLTVERIKVPDWLEAQLDEPVVRGIPKSWRRLIRANVLVLDNFAVAPANVAQSHLLLRLLDARNEPDPKSSLVLSPTPVEDWKDSFECPTAAAAMVARLDWGHRVVLKAPASRDGVAGVGKVKGP